jgi:RecA-family ATPase
MSFDAPRDAPSADFSLEPLNVIAPTSWEGRAIPDQEWIWEDWIPVGSVTALYGDGGTGKSLLALQLMTACATGKLFLGQDVRPVKAFGVFCEDDENELMRRLSKITVAYDLSFADLGNLRLVSRVGNENLLMTFAADGHGVPTPFFSQVLNAARDFGARLVVIDTAADTFAGNENIRPQVRQFIALLTRLAQTINGAVILLAHPSQSGKASGSGEGGSTAWNNSVRSRLYFKRPGQPDEKHADASASANVDPDLRVLFRAKSNYAAMGVELPAKWERGAFVAATGEAGAAIARGPQRDRQADEAFMSGLDELKTKGIRCNVHKGQANFAPKAMRDKTLICTGFAEAELTAAMNRLIQAGRITSVEEGPPSRLRSFLKVVAPDLPGT